MRSFLSRLLLLGLLMIFPVAATGSVVERDLGAAESAVRLATADLSPGAAAEKLRLRKVTVERIVWVRPVVAAKAIHDEEKHLVEGVEYWRVTFEIEGDGTTESPDRFEVNRYVDAQTGRLVSPDR